MSKHSRQGRLLDILREATSNPFSIQEGRFRFGQLKDSVYYSDWTEESFLSDNSHKGMVTRSFNFAKLKYLVLIAVLALSVLIARTAWLQVVKGEHYYLLSEDNRLRAEIIEPKRGIVYDRNLLPLVRNKANFVLYLRPIELPKAELERDSLIREISTILETKEQSTSLSQATSSQISLNGRELDLVADSSYFYKIKELLSAVKIGSLQSYQPLFIQDGIDYETAMLISLKLPDWPGVFLTNKIRREYLVAGENDSEVATTTSLSHILGYTGKISEKELADLRVGYSLIDYVGKVGLEYSWEKELRGLTGRKNIEVDALGRQKKVVSETLAQDGYNLQLSLDLKLQQKIESILQDKLSGDEPKRASVIVMDPRTGAILSLVSWPAYDNNIFARGIKQGEYEELINNTNRPLFNRAISGEFPSGSTIKPIFAAGALQDGVITDKTTFLSNGGLRIGQWFFPDWRAGGHGLTDVRRAIAFSVNTFFYYIGGGFGDFQGMGLDGLVKYSRLFGLGEKTGIDISGEVAGFVPTRAWKEQAKNEPWYIGDTYHFAIGQGDVLVTPLQVANYTAAIANGGKLYQPYLVAKVMDSNNQAVRTVEPKVIRENFISPGNMEIVREGMRQTITVGSGRLLNSLPVTSAGKTGTAQWSSQKNTHAWFIGFAPYDNPEVSITILVEEGGEGSSIGAAIAYDILNWYFRPTETTGEVINEQ